jgi:hypothetical protein
MKRLPGAPLSHIISSHIHPPPSSVHIKGRRRLREGRGSSFDTNRLMIESVLALLQRKLNNVAIVVSIRHSVTTDNDADDDSIPNNSLAFHSV